MNLIKVSTQFYPYTLTELRQDYPLVSFPSDMSGVDLADFDAAFVTYAPQPVYNSETHYLEPLSPQLVNDSWVVDWLIKERVIIPQPDWPSFNLALFTNVDFVAYGVTSNTVNPYLVPALVERYGRVATQGIVGSGFDTYWNIFCDSLSITMVHRESWAVLAEANNLPLDFVQLIRGV